ncbi:hypothetical protein HKD37_15G043708 [Glycine soja]
MEDQEIRLIGGHNCHKLRRKDFKAVEIQIDSEEVVNSIKGLSNGSSAGWSLIQAIRKVTEGNWLGSKYLCLANAAHDMQVDFFMYEQPPTFLSQLLLADAMEFH